DLVTDGGLGLDDVGGVAAGVGDRVAKPGVGRDVFAQVVGGDIGQLHRIERAATVVRILGGVGAAADEAEEDSLRRERGGGVDVVRIARVPGQGDIDIVERPGGDHEHL